MISATIKQPMHLILTRLKLEALLVSHGFSVRVQSGTIWVASQFGRFPVLISHSADGGYRVQARIVYGACAGVDDELSDFIAAVNLRDEGVRLAVEDAGEVAFSWEQVFPDSVECDLVVRGLARLGDACVEVGNELAERFFVNRLPVIDVREGGVR